MWKIIGLILALTILLGCGSYSAYDDGYDDGYDGARKVINFGGYSRGYEDGAEDAYYFDIGYRDGRNEEPPRYSDNAIYMEGYEEGR